MKKSILIIITLILLFNSSFVLADNIDSTRDKIDAQLFNIIRIIGYTIILFCGFKEIVQKAMEGDKQGVGSVFIKYIMIYAALLGFPAALKWVEVFIEGMK